MTLLIYRMETPLRILSLDGGGVRGISSLYILKELMAQVIVGSYIMFADRISIISIYDDQ